MSLINKMLQDLDARGSQAGSALPADVRPASPVRRQLPVRQIAIAASVVVLGAALAAVFWLKRPGAPVGQVVAVAAPGATVAKPIMLPPGSQLVTSPMVPLDEARKMPTLEHKPETTPVVQAPSPPVSAVPRVEQSERAAPPVRQVRVVREAKVERDVAAVAPPAREMSIASPVNGGRNMHSTQQAESPYRLALAALDEGRVAAALEGLGQALRINPRHDAARQSLVALLIEAGRNDEAMQQLEQGLAMDPAQPTLAMLLARMQIERGSSGVATLLRTLPSATGNADYHAFLGGALQREARHREAAEQYGAALRQAPEHGVWLMGLGISLQAEKRDREALAAFQRAKASGTLTAPLLAFVERKIQQLAP